MCGVVGGFGRRGVVGAAEQLLWRSLQIRKSRWSKPAEPAEPGGRSQRPAVKRITIVNITGLAPVIAYVVIVVIAYVRIASRNPGQPTPATRISFQHDTMFKRYNETRNPGQPTPATRISFQHDTMFERNNETRNPGQPTPATRVSFMFKRYSETRNPRQPTPALLHSGIASSLSQSVAISVVLQQLITYVSGVLGTMADGTGHAHVLPNGLLDLEPFPHFDSDDDQSEVRPEVRPEVQPDSPASSEAPGSDVGPKDGLSRTVTEALAVTATIAEALPL